MNIREALLAMGYQEQEPGKWLKPVGYHLLACNEKTLVNFFKGQDGSILAWDSKILNPDNDPVSQIKEFECWTRFNIYSQSNFEVRAVDL